jgi:hypothetical protein
MNLFRNNFFIGLIVLTISLTFLPLKAVYAEDAIGALWDVVSGSLTFALDTSIAIINMPLNLALGVVEVAIGSVTGIDFFGDDGSCRLQNIGSGSMELYSGRCDESGVGFVMTVSGDDQCATKVDNIFYIPSANLSYKLTYFYYRTGNCRDVNGDIVCDYTKIYLGDGEPRYTYNEDTGTTCNGTPDPNGLLAMVDLDGSGTLVCGNLIPEYVPDPSFNEADRQIAIYRFTLPADSDQATLNHWFVNIIRSEVGSGWVDMSTVELANAYSQADYRWTERVPYETLAYSSSWCSGNACRYIDGAAPDNSYVAYVAKILGSYTYPAFEYDRDGDARTSHYTRENKFLNKDNAPATVFPYSTLGNAISGPFETTTAICQNILTVTKSSGGTQTQTIIDSSPAGCVGGTPDQPLTQSCP